LARREGIDYDAIPESLRDTAVEPGDPVYPRHRSTYLRGGAPGLILHPRTTAQVVEALAFSRRQPVPFGIRSAGHGLSGRSTNDGGIILSVAALNSIEVLDEATRRFRVGPGAHWSEVAAALEPHGWSLTSGDYGGVGVGGLATAGGIGWLAREHGLTIDHLRAVDIVVADGRVIRASETENADLFWAVRGAGANFGIVVSFEFEADEQKNSVGYAQFVLDATDMAGVLERWGATVEAAPRDVTSALILQRGAPPIASVMAVVDSDDPDTIISRLQPLADIAPLLQQNVQLMPYAEIMANDHGAGWHNGQGEPHARSGLVNHITPEFARAAAAAIWDRGLYWFQMRAVGGAVSDVPPDATAYAHRSANFSLVTMGADDDRLNSAWEGLYGHMSGLYLSFESGLHEGRIADAFPPATLARLLELKREWDPTNVFRDNFNIVPSED
jgi:FAD/FMN-containing dehydrogenase